MNAEVAVIARPKITKREARKALNEITVRHRKEKIGDTRFEFYEETDDGKLIYTEIDNGVRRGRVVVGRAMGRVRIVSGFVFTSEMLLAENPQLKVLKKKKEKVHAKSRKKAVGIRTDVSDSSRIRKRRGAKKSGRNSRRPAAGSRKGNSR